MYIYYYFIFKYNKYFYRNITITLQKCTNYMFIPTSATLIGIKKLCYILFFLCFFKRIISFKFSFYVYYIYVFFSCRHVCIRFLYLKKLLLLLCCCCYYYYCYCYQNLTVTTVLSFSLPKTYRTK